MLREFGAWGFESFGWRRESGPAPEPFPVIPETTVGTVFGDSRISAVRSRAALAGVDSELVPGSGVSEAHLLARGIDNWMQVLTHGNFELPTDMNFAAPGDSIANQLSVIDANLAGAVADGAGFVVWLAGRGGLEDGDTGPDLVADATAAINKFKAVGVPVLLIIDWPDMAPTGTAGAAFTSSQADWDAMLELRAYYLSLKSDPYVTVVDGWAMMGPTGPAPALPVDNFLPYTPEVLNADWNAKAVWDLRHTAGAPTLVGLKQLGVDALPAGWSYIPESNILGFWNTGHSPSDADDEANLLDHELLGWEISDVQIIVNNGCVIRLRECYVREQPFSYQAKADNNSNAVMLIEDCTFDMEQSTADTLGGIYFGYGCTGHVKNTKVIGQGRDNIISAGDGILIEDVYAGVGSYADPSLIPEPHHDGVTVISGSATIRRVISDFATRGYDYGARATRINNHIRMAVNPASTVDNIISVTVEDFIGVGNGDGNGAFTEINNKLNSGAQADPVVTFTNVLWEPGLPTEQFALNDPGNGTVQPASEVNVVKMVGNGPRNTYNQQDFYADLWRRQSAPGAFQIAKLAMPVLLEWDASVPALPTPGIALPPMGTTGGNTFGTTGGTTPTGWLSTASNLAGITVTGSADTITVDGTSTDAQRSVMTGTAGTSATVRMLEYQGGTALVADTPLRLYADIEVTKMRGVQAFYMSFQDGFGANFVLWQLAPVLNDGTPDEPFSGRFVSPLVTLQDGMTPAISFVARFEDGATVDVDLKIGNVVIEEVLPGPYAPLPAATWMIPADEATFDNATNWVLDTNITITGGQAVKAAGVGNEDLEIDVAGITTGRDYIMYLDAEMSAGVVSPRMSTPSGFAADGSIGGTRKVTMPLTSTDAHTGIVTRFNAASLGALNEVNLMDITDKLAGPLHIYILGGQSNILGASAVTDFDTHADQEFRALMISGLENTAFGRLTDNSGLSINSDLTTSHGVGIPTPMADPIGGSGANTTGVSPAVAIAKAICDQGVPAGVTPVFVCAGWGGTSLFTEWNPDSVATNGGVAWDLMIAQIDYLMGLNASSVVRGMFWCQGESDRSADPSSYAPAMNSRIDLLRSTYSTTMPTVIMEIGGSLPDTNTELMIAEQQKLATGSGDASELALCTYVPRPAVATLEDGTHFTPSVNVQRGEDAAAAMIAFFSGAPVAGSFDESFDDSFG